jgi:uncharacterized protein
MKCYFFKLVPPRPSFPLDMSPQEAQLMQQHAAYWSGLMQQGKVHAFGPVADSAGPYGMAVVELADGEDPQALGAADPVVAGGIGFKLDVSPMPALVVPGRGRIG